jgi:hypothetical protein
VDALYCAPKWTYLNVPVFISAVPCYPTGVFN